MQRQINERANKYLHSEGCNIGAYGDNNVPI